MNAKLLLFSICTLARSDGSVSLLQTHATKRHTAAFNITNEWAKGFNQCREIKNKFMTDRTKCKMLEMDAKGKYPDPRSCALETQRRGGDTFNFLPVRKRNPFTRCKIFRCGTTQMLVKRSKWLWKVYSRFCGLQLLKRPIGGKCDKGGISSYLQYLPPPQHACATPLDFTNGMKNNNLGNKGPGSGAASMRFRRVLPGVDLQIKVTDGYFPAQASNNKRYKKWGAQVNLNQDTETHFVFSFVESQGQKKVKVPSFMFTVFDLDQSSGCQTRTYVNASRYSSFYVANNTELAIHTKVPTPAEIINGKAISTRFESTMRGGKKNNPQDPMKLTADQASRAVTFVYENVKTFYLGFGVTNGTHGKNIVFGGSSSITDALCAQAEPDPSLPGAEQPQIQARR